LLIIAGLLLASASANADVHVSNQVNYYNVHGTSYQELTRDFFSKCRVVDGGYRCANTTMKFTSRIVQDINCKVEKVNMYVDYTVTYPKWVDYGHPWSPLYLKEKWNAKMSATVAHEEEHVRQGLEAAHQIDNYFNSRKWGTDCSDNERILNQEHRKLLS
jgi:predicted secreted Zn-dependent protease